MAKNYGEYSEDDVEDSVSDENEEDLYSEDGREDAIEDDEVDELFQSLILKMTSELKNDNIDPNEAIYILMVAKYFKRVGDHAVNIAQWIIFMARGTHKNTLLF